MLFQYNSRIQEQSSNTIDPTSMELTCTWDVYCGALLPSFSLVKAFLIHYHLPGVINVISAQCDRAW